jgi:hypothetical protein
MCLASTLSLSSDKTPALELPAREFWKVSLLYLECFEMALFHPKGVICCMYRFKMGLLKKEAVASDILEIVVRLFSVLTYGTGELQFQKVSKLEGLFQFFQDTVGKLQARPQETQTAGAETSSGVQVLP